MQISQLDNVKKQARRTLRQMDSFGSEAEDRAITSAMLCVGAPDDALAYRQALLEQHGIQVYGGPGQDREFRFRSA